MAETDELKRLSEAIEDGDVDRIEEIVRGLVCEDVKPYEHILHRAFQIQPGSMNVPPNPEVINILTSNDMIAPIYRGIYNVDAGCVEAALKDDSSQLEKRDASSYTPFLRAAETCKTSIISLLIDKGADIQATRDNGFGALHLAAWNEIHPQERVDTLMLLADSGCDVNRLSHENATPLMLASMCFKENSVECLLKLGADPGLKSNEGKTALDYAKATNYNPVISLLTNA